MSVDNPRVWIMRRKNVKKDTYFLRWIDPVAGKWRSRRIGTDRKLAEREAARVEDQLAQGTFREVRTISWSDFLKDHVKKIPGKRNASEAEATLKEFGEMVGPSSPKHVSYSAIERYVADLRSRNQSPSTINKKLRYLRAALNRAVKRGFAGRNPMDGDLFQPTDEKAIRIATVDEENALLESADCLYGNQLRTFIFVALRCGGRRDELLALSWSRVCLDVDSASVQFTGTKSHRNRVVPIDDLTAAALQRLLVQAQQDRGPFCALGNGRRVYQKFDRVRQHAKVPDITIHDLRRTYISRLVRAGVPLPQVQKLAGHSTIQTTMQHYTAVAPQDLREAVSKLASAAG